jgi:hypothetical protein
MLEENPDNNPKWKACPIEKSKCILLLGKT